MRDIAIQIISCILVWGCIIGFCCMLVINAENEAEKMKKKRTPEKIQKDNEEDGIFMTAALCALLDSFENEK